MPEHLCKNLTCEPVGGHQDTSAHGPCGCGLPGGGCAGPSLCTVLFALAPSVIMLEGRGAARAAGCWQHSWEGLPKAWRASRWGGVYSLLGPPDTAALLFHS